MTEYDDTHAQEDIDLGKYGKSIVEKIDPAAAIGNLL